MNERKTPIVVGESLIHTLLSYSFLSICKSNSTSIQAKKSAIVE